MNLVISENLNAIRPEVLPARRAGARVRGLFIWTVGLGFRRYYEQVARYTAADAELEAVHIAVRQPMWVKLFCATVPVLRRGGWDQKSLRYQIAWRAILRRWFRGPLALERFDFVHIGHGIAWGIVPFARRAGGTKFAVNADVTAVQDWRELGYSRAGRRPMVAVERAIYEATDLVVCRNAWCRRSVVEDFGVAEARTHLALSSIPRGPERVERAEGGPVRIVFIGHQFQRKGGPELLRLHQEKLADRAELHICSGGVAPDRSARNVIWHGSVPNERLRNEILPSMDLFVFPTKHDMSPWAVIEAADAGLPVVSTRVGAVPDMVIDGVSGLLLAPGDQRALAAAVVRLVDDAKLRRSMGAAGREHIGRNYNPDEQYGGLLERLKRLGR